MYTIVDIITGAEIRTHDMFRVSAPFPGIELGENEKVVLVPDVLVEQLNSAYECIIAVDAEGVATDITITKTMEQYWQENPPPPQPPTTEDYLIDLDYRLCLVELGLL